VRPYAVIETARCRVRPAVEADLPHVVRWWNDPEVRAAHALGAAPLSLAQVTAWFRDAVPRPWVWMAERKGPTDLDYAGVGPIGMLELAEVAQSTVLPGARGRGALELGVTLDRAYRGQGFGRELVAALAAWVLGSGMADRVELTVLKGNVRAVRCFTHAGFRVETSGPGRAPPDTLRMVFAPQVPTGAGSGGPQTTATAG